LDLQIIEAGLKALEMRIPPKQPPIADPNRFEKAITIQKAAVEH